MPPADEPDTPPKAPGRFRPFRPILAGATLRERAIACLGALLGIALTALICGQFLAHGPALPLIAAPMGATAVLLFAVPASPLAQPWPIIGGNTVSALVGLVVAQLVQEPVLAVGLAVSLAIAAMSVTRSLHPPGGAMALTAALGGAAVAPYGYLFPLLPVALNSLVLTALGIAFHRFSGRSYPHVAAAAAVNSHLTRDPPAQLRGGFTPEDLDAALTALDETFDVDRGDLERLLLQVERQALLRTQGGLRCRDIMSRDVVKIGPEESPDRARALLLAHAIRTLPVVDAEGRLLGSIGLRELALGEGRLETLVAAPTTAGADDPAVELVPTLTDGRSHAVVVVDADRRILGLITQTDLLVALARAASGPVPPHAAAAA